MSTPRSGASTISIAVATTIALWATPGAAQPDASVGAAAAGASPGVGYAGGELGVGQIDEDFFLTVNITGALRLDVPKVFCRGYFDELEVPEEGGCETPLSLGLRVPLRLRVFDRDPQDAGVLRREDWDTPGDFARVVRFVEYGLRTDPLYGRLGEFNGAVLGHGTIMNRYFNVLFLDHYQLGLNLNVNAHLGGVEFVMDNLLEPQVWGSRVFARPAYLIDPTSWWTRYVIGLSLVLDVDAPLDFERVSIEQDPATPVEVTDDGRLIPSREKVTGVLGIDHALELVRTEEVDFTPYIDINLHLAQSAGLHIGALTNFRPTEGLSLLTRLELRLLGQNHIPAYFGPLYEIEREAFFGFGGQGQPKLVVLQGLDRGGVAGSYAELTVDVSGLMTLTGAYEDYQGPENASVWLRLQLPKVGPITLAALYQNSGFDDINDVFSLDNTLMLAEARYDLNPFLYLLAQASRQFRLQNDGQYETVTNWQLGAGAAIGF